MSKIEGLKLIRHNRQRINRPDDPSYPFKLEAAFRLPAGTDSGLMVMMGGREEIVVRARTVDAVREFVKRNRYIGHPRLLDLKLTGPEGVLKIS